VTREVLLLARWMAADLYLRDVDHLAAELSMQQASDALKAKAGDSAEPYRAVLKQLRERLRATRNWAHASLSASTPRRPMFTDNRDLLDPLELCFHSLHECGMGVIADGPLLDCLRRAVTFGLFLVRLDVRQDSTRHSSAMTEITDYLGLGRYEDWDEEQRISFLMRELSNRRPLLPAHFKPSADTAEVLATCAKSPPRQGLPGLLCDLHGGRGLRCAGGATAAQSPACCGRCAWCRCSKPSPTWTTPGR
jgi:phosphoenolpyruvate carboxylase